MLNGTSPVFEIIAKISTTTEDRLCVSCGQIDIDVLRPMLRALLEDRFKMAAHYEDRPMTAFTLVAAKPKLKKADPSARTACKRGAARIPGQPEDAPALGVTFACQNMTIAQFADQLQGMAQTYIDYPVLNATGLEGSWDFNFVFSGVPPNSGAVGAKGGPAPGASGAPSDPIGGISLFDALDKQLGLKLEAQKRPEPVLVIDHIEEKPTDN